MLGPVAHIGLVVARLAEPMAVLATTGVRWSSVVREQVQYVAQAGGEPRLKLISGDGGGYFAPPPGDTAVHHLSHWVDELEPAIAVLAHNGYCVEATGLEPDGVTPRYAYLVAPGLIRIELGLERHRAEFDAWAGGL